MSKLVKVHVRDQDARNVSAYLPLRWEAIGPGGEPFAALDADITLTPAGEHATTLALAGVYRPPPGSQGNGGDRATVRPVAEETIRVFFDRIAEALFGPGPADEQDDGAAGGCGSGPPAAQAP